MKILFLAFFISISTCFGKNLSETALFQRCYTHLTQTYPEKNNILLTKVKNGQLTATAACWQLIESTSFVPGDISLLTDPNDKEARNILKVFHNLHYSWFSTKFFPEIQDNHLTNVANVYDPSSPALYFTKALFTTQASFSDIFLGDQTYRSIRHEGRPHSIDWTAHSPAVDILTGIKFSSIGELIGIETMPKNDTYNVLADANSGGPAVPFPSININTHWGGGVLGNQIYLLQNIDAPGFDYKPDGGVKSSRKWSRSVFHDFLCRTLPAVRENDGTPYVLNNSSLTYRNSKGCVKCHASADTMAGLIRNAKYDPRGHFFDPKGHYVFLTKYSTTKQNSSYFPGSPDADFAERPTTGNFYFRTYDGVLISREASDLNSLGQSILDLDDAYICTAKRYFEYFTGISADITDIKDPANPNYPSLSAHQLRYRNSVVNLGKSLKSHKSLKLLIKDILESPYYRSENFKLTE